MLIIIILISIWIWLFWYQIKEESINVDWWIEWKISIFQMLTDIILSFVIALSFTRLFWIIISYLQEEWFFKNHTFYNYIEYIIFVIIFYLSLQFFVKRHNVFTKKDDIKKISEWVTIYFFTTYILLELILFIAMFFITLSDRSSIEKDMSDMKKIKNDYVSEYKKDMDHKLAEYEKKIENNKIYNNKNVSVNIKDENSVVQNVIDEQKWNTLTNTSISSKENDIKKINEELDKKVTEYINKKENPNSIKQVSYNKYDLSETNDKNNTLFDINLWDRWCDEWYPKLLNHNNKYFIARNKWNEKDIENFIKTDKVENYSGHYYPFSFIVERNLDNLEQVNKYILEKTNWHCKVHENEEGYLDVIDLMHDWIWPGYCSYKEYLYKNNTLISIFYWQEYFCKWDDLILKSLKVK